MNQSKAMFMALFMSVISLLMVSAVSALPPAVSISGVPANVIAGTNFEVSVAAVNGSAGQFINTVSLFNDLNWAVTPQTANCGLGLASCVAGFTVTVPSTAVVGQRAVLTAIATASTSETGSQTATVTVSGTPSIGNRVPVTVDAVEIDGFQLSSTDVNVRDIERGSEFSLRIKLTALANANDVEIRAFITGFEFSSTEDISDSTRPFDVSKGVSYVKTLSLKLPDRAQADNYRIRVIIAGRNNDELVQNFKIKVSPTDHEVIIRELSVTPETVQAGRAVLATVRVKNLGQSVERDVRVRVSIPELGVTATPDFIDRVESDESVTSEEFFLRLDSCAKAGVYNVKAEVTFEEGDRTVVANKQITVTSGVCEAAGAVQASGGVKIAYTAESQNIKAGGEAAAYVITIENDGDTTKSYTLSAGADWATVRISPSNLLTVRGGDSQTAYVYVSANRNAAQGGQSLIVRIKDQAGDVVKELPLAANVIGGAGAGATGLVQVMQVGLIALIAVLVVVAVAVAFRKMKGPREGEEGTQTYY